jgi:hypothetical protein
MTERVALADGVTPAAVRSVIPAAVTARGAVARRKPGAMVPQGGIDGGAWIPASAGMTERAAPCRNDGEGGALPE